MGLSFTIAACPRQRSQSQFRVPRDSWLHFIVSDSRLFQPGGPGLRTYDVNAPGTGWPVCSPRHWVPISSPPTTCKVALEVFDPASTRATLSVAPVVFLITPWHGPYREQRPFYIRPFPRGRVRVTPATGALSRLLRICCPSNGRCFATVTKQRLYTLQLKKNVSRTIWASAQYFHSKSFLGFKSFC
jgi:hypothetical protein